ncbi:MAG: homocysteine methyltransferase, partial [Planctomycetes bacterium]|nr:homocysteine methyltransferase [Planctomycetota bacterium]
MASMSLSERIKQGVLLIDGAMGTELFVRGVKAGSSNNYLNVTDASVVKEVHAAYFAAGSDAVITNTFEANGISLLRHGLADEVAKINIEGAKIAREAAEEAAKDGRDRYVLGGLGPCGDFLEPLGMVKAEDLKAAFADQAKALVDGGVDGFIIETMTAIEEIEVAIEAVKSVCDLPVFVSLAYDGAGDEFRTMMGVDCVTAVEKLCGLGIDAIGFNCGTLDMDGYVKLAQSYAKALAGRDVAL